MGALPPEILILVVAVFSAFAGALLTWILTSIGGGEKTDEPLTLAEQPPAAPDEEALLRVSRIEGGLAIFVRGQRYRRLLDIADPQTGREAAEAIKVVLTFAEGWLPALQGQKPPRPTPQEPSRRESAEDEAAFLEQLRRSTSVPSSARPSGAQSLMLVEEIDALLQERLQRRPDLAERRIRIANDIDGSILIYVGQQRYRSSDDIRDAEVRGFIQETIREWESR